MPKAVDITPRMAELLKAGTNDPEFDHSLVNVFGTVFANTKPMNKRGSLYDRARLSRSTLVQMAEHVNSGNSVPLQSMHSRGDLPFGRVFYAAVTDGADGESDLRGYFFVDKQHGDLIRGIESGTINSVSVGVLPKKVLCSECGFDYLGPKADVMNLWDQVCDEGHVVGEDGVHVRSVDLDYFYEVSLVGDGAITDAKIRSAAAAQMKAGDSESYKKLAASGIPTEAVVLVASVKEEKKSMPDSGFDLSATVKEMSDLKADNLIKTRELTDLKAQLEVVAKANVDLAAALKVAEAYKQEAEEFAGVKGFLSEHCKAALVALGEKEPKIPDSLKEQIEMIKASSLKLHQLIPAGGVTKGSETDVEADTTVKSRSAFKTRK